MHRARTVIAAVLFERMRDRAQKMITITNPAGAWRRKHRVHLRIAKVDHLGLPPPDRGPSRCRRKPRAQLRANDVPGIALEHCLQIGTGRVP
jgi:hypothetical protein